jgi:hypothetical protein
MKKIRFRNNGSVITAERELAIGINRRDSVATPFLFFLGAIPISQARRLGYNAGANESSRDWNAVEEKQSYGSRTGKPLTRMYMHMLSQADCGGQVARTSFWNNRIKWVRQCFQSGLSECFEN